MHKSSLSRREFLKTALVGMGGMAAVRFPGLTQEHSPSFPVGHTPRLSVRGSPIAEFPDSERLGRVFGGKVSVKAKPDIDSPEVGVVYEDQVVPWLRELVGSRPLWYNQRFVETSDGYIYAPNLQPVRNLPNTPLQELPAEGVWVEVTVPYVDLVQQNPPGRSPWLQNTAKPRLYYSQIMWVDQLKTDEQGQVWYQVKEKYGTFGDIFWVPAQALRVIPAAEMEPLNPEVEEKHVEVNLTRQTLSCFEGSREVYFCQVSTGTKHDAEGNPVEKWSTPVGPHSIWRKMVSVHMTGGTTGGGYDLPGIGWTVLFSGNGVAIHSTFWHNNFGVPMSHGCVNARPDDAKWVFRWTMPTAPADSGDITISGTSSTKVVVVES